LSNVYQNNFNLKKSKKAMNRNDDRADAGRVPGKECGQERKQNKSTKWIKGGKRDVDEG
jgi:hypothetical protein